MKIIPKRGCEIYPKMTMGNLINLKLFPVAIQVVDDKITLSDKGHKNGGKGGGVNTPMVLKICKSFNKKKFDINDLLQKVNVKDDADKFRITSCLYRLHKKHKIEKIKQGGGSGKLTVYKNV